MGLLGIIDFGQKYVCLAKDENNDESSIYLLMADALLLSFTINLDLLSILSECLLSKLNKEGKRNPCQRISIKFQ